MGKTAAGAVWLNPQRLSPYDFWQSWRNTEDADVGRFLRLFTELPLSEVAKLEALKYPGVVLPDMVVDQHSAIELGGTRVDLIYVGRNHSDNSLVMLLPKEKILFAVDFIPVQAVMFRDMPDGFLPDWFDSLDRVLALDFTTLIPGHPGPGGRMGTKDDVRAVKEYLTDLSNATRELANQGKCFDEAMKTLKLPKYESWANYGTYLQGNIERFCEYWGRGM